MPLPVQHHSPDEQLSRPLQPRLHVCRAVAHHDHTVHTKRLLQHTTAPTTGRKVKSAPTYLYTTVPYKAFAFVAWCGSGHVACSRCTTAALLAPVLHAITRWSERVPRHAIHALPGLQVPAPVLLHITHGAKQQHTLLAPELLPITRGI